MGVGPAQQAHAGDEVTALVSIDDVLRAARDGDLTTVAWQMWDNAAQRPGRWSKTHDTTDGGATTLCGIDVTGFNHMDSGPHGDGVCKRCRAKMRAAEAESRRRLAEVDELLK